MESLGPTYGFYKMTLRSRIELCFKKWPIKENARLFSSAYFLKTISPYMIPWNDVVEILVTGAVPAIMGRVVDNVLKHVRTLLERRD